MRVNLFLLLLIFCLFSCSSNEEDEKILKVSPSELIFSPNEESKEFQIESNSAWKINGVPDWVTLNYIEGNGNKKIVIKVKENPKEEDRLVVLKIVIRDKESTLNIKQFAKNVILGLSKKEMIFEAEPSDAGDSFDIISNEAWEITDIPEWCALSSPNGSGNTKITVTVDKNYVDDERFADIQIKAGSKTEGLKLKQEPLNIILHFSNEDFTSLSIMSFMYGASSKSVIIKSNTKWTVQSSNPDWCKIDKTSGMDNGSLSILVSENKNKTDRLATVFITAGSKSIKIIVRQSRYIEVDENNPYQLNERDNSPRIGDRLKKKQVEYVNPREGGENITWNFSSLNVINDDYEVVYSEPPFDSNENVYILGKDRFKVDETTTNSLYVCTEHNTMYYFQVKDDLLQALGHENPTVILKYEPRMIIGIYPMYYNSYHKSDYKTTALYSATVDMESKGYGEIKADGYGTIVLPTGTYPNVLRTKFVQTIDYTNNSKSKEQEYTIYKWYVKGYRYPVLETHRSINLDDNSEIFSTAFYYPPTDHTYINNNQKAFFVRNASMVKSSVSMGKSSLLESFIPVIKMRK
ncbi:MAG: BACON domain-containing protein [Prevotella sp.]|jgi:hypothetical protein|nr:BACON domain-containing protein [Prevotella sp.]